METLINLFTPSQKHQDFNIPHIKTPIENWWTRADGTVHSTYEQEVKESKTKFQQYYETTKTYIEECEYIHLMTSLLNNKKFQENGPNIYLHLQEYKFKHTQKKITEMSKFLTKQKEDQEKELLELSKFVTKEKEDRIEYLQRILDEETRSVILQVVCNAGQNEGDGEDNALVNQQKSKVLAIANQDEQQNDTQEQQYLAQSNVESTNQLSCQTQNFSLVTNFFRHFDGKRYSQSGGSYVRFEVNQSQYSVFSSLLTKKEYLSALRNGIMALRFQSSYGNKYVFYTGGHGEEDVGPALTDESVSYLEIFQTIADSMIEFSTNNPHVEYFEMVLIVDTCYAAEAIKVIQTEEINQIFNQSFQITTGELKYLEFYIMAASDADQVSAGNEHGKCPSFFTEQVFKRDFDSQADWWAKLLTLENFECPFLQTDFDQDYGRLKDGNGQVIKDANGKPKRKIQKQTFKYGMFTKCKDTKYGDKVIAITLQ